MPASPMAPLRSTTTRRVTRAAASSQNSRKRRSNAGPDPLFSGDEDKDDDDTVGTNAATAVTTANSTTPAPGSPSWGAWTAVKVAVGIVAALAVTRRAVFPLATAQEWATRHAHNVAGKTFVVTGGSSGVGFETAKALAAAGGNVVLTSRDLKRGALAVDTIKRSAFGPISQTGGQVRFLQLDQASIASVTEFADRLVQTTGAIHGLVLNAGQISQQFQCSEDGIERTFQVNHLANQILVNRTADALVRGSARVVVVTSFQGARYFRQSAAAASAPHTTAAAFGMFESYGNSKLANVRFARELSRRLGHGNVTAVSVHPGMISTNLGVSRGVGVLDWLDRVGARLFWLAMSPLTKSAQEGAATQTLCVVAPLAEVEAGGFYKDNRLSDAFPTTFQSNKQDEALDHETWEITEGLIRGDPTYRCGGGDQSAASAEPTSDRQRARADRDSDDNSARNMVLLVLLHPVLYLALFSTAEAVFGRSAGAGAGAADEAPAPAGRTAGTVAAAASVAVPVLGLDKINTTFPKPALVALERHRTLRSSLIDGGYAVLLWHHGRVAPGGLTPVSGLVYGLVILLWTDAHFTLTHRLLHTQPLYRIVHSVHHQSRNPGPWSSLSFHPIEAVVYFSAYLICLAVPLPSWALIGMKVGMVVGPLHAHLGYDLGPVVTGARHHYIHHTLVNCNYGGVPTGLWDKLLGTEHRDRRASPAATGSSNAIPTVSPTSLLAAMLLTRTAAEFVATNVLAAAALLVWILLVDGTLWVRPLGPRKKRKVFVIGLSRTGTTSITAALNGLGWRTYHFFRHLVAWDPQTGRPTTVPAAADAFDGFTDIAPTLVFEELVDRHPDALFVQTTRPAKQWGEAMIRFTGGQPNRMLFLYHPVPNTFYRRNYGDGWADYTAPQWAGVMTAYDARVASCFVGCPDRLLRLDVSAPSALSELASFIGANEAACASVEGQPFPHRLVFEFSFLAQPAASVCDALAYLKSWRALGLAVAATVLLCGGALADLGQCGRVCQTRGGHSGAGGRLTDPSVFTRGDRCTCADGTTPPRFYPAESYRPTESEHGVCGADGAAHASAKAAHTNGTLVVNCGGCGKCSRLDATAGYRRMGDAMTLEASRCAVVNLVLGTAAGRACVEGWMGLPAPCSQCWRDNMDCTVVHCFRPCVLGHGTPLSGAANNVPTPGGGTELSSCLACDERHCSPSFLRCAGANRRTAGVRTDITRPDRELCTSAAADFAGIAAAAARKEAGAGTGSMYSRKKEGPSPFGAETEAVGMEPERVRSSTPCGGMPTMNMNTVSESSVPMPSNSGTGSDRGLKIPPPPKLPPVQSHPISVGDLPGTIVQMSTNSGFAFSEEYECLETGSGFSREAAQQTENKMKNRYSDILAYDHTRVRLSVIPGDSYSDYINANYINGHGKSNVRKYIAAQGPTALTVIDFWRMIFEQDADTVMMVTNCEEKGRIKCQRYWPAGTDQDMPLLDNFFITMTNVEQFADYAVRTMVLNRNGSVRTLRQYHYSSWPDHGVPDATAPILEMLRKARITHSPSRGPMVIHCSAGVGRTGTLIAIDHGIDQATDSTKIDVFSCLNEMRRQRNAMVQTEEQYIFVYRALADTLLSAASDFDVQASSAHQGSVEPGR